MNELIEKLKAENGELKAQLATCRDSFELIESNLSISESARPLRADEKMMIQLAREALKSLESKDE